MGKENIAAKNGESVDGQDTLAVRNLGVCPRGVTDRVNCVRNRNYGLSLNSVLQYAPPKFSVQAAGHQESNQSRQVGVRHRI